MTKTSSTPTGPPGGGASPGGYANTQTEIDPALMKVAAVVISSPALATCRSEPG